MLFLSGGYLHVLCEIAALFCCFQKHIIIGADNLLCVWQADSLMVFLCTKAFLFEFVQSQVIFLKTVAYDDCYRIWVLDDIQPNFGL